MMSIKKRQTHKQSILAIIRNHTSLGELYKLHDKSVPDLGPQESIFTMPESKINMYIPIGTLLMDNQSPQPCHWNVHGKS